MRNHLSAGRRKWVLRLGIVAAVLVALAMVSSVMDRDPRVSNERMGQTVLPNFASARADTAEIRITLADEAYTLIAGPDGWTMPDASNYPIRADRLAVLANGLETARWAETMTRDPAKFDRISVGDPRGGGTGALITVLGRDGNVTAELITGTKAGRFYARRPGEDKTFRIQGEMPPLYAKDAWLNLEIVEINPDAIMGVRVTDGAARELFLRRGVGQGPRSFRPGPPFEADRLRDRLAASSTALALTRFAPIGVKAADELSTQPVARHITMTHDGGEIDVSAYREPDGVFVTLRAIEAGEGAYRAETINDSAAGWAFELSDYDWQDFAPDVSAIVLRGPPEADAAVP